MKEYEKHTQDLYNNIDKIWPINNAWYDYTHKIIISFILEYKKLLSSDSKILNAGSGGSEYDIPGEFYHVDLSGKHINRFTHHYISSVEKMPFENNVFDFTICVGSVINYCNALTALSEIDRVTKTNSYLILEYERSLTGELLWNKSHGKSTTLQIYNFNGQENHKLWLYSDKYINHILQELQYKIIDDQLFHSLSSVYNGLFDNELKAGKIAKYDKYLPRLIKYNIAHNRILICHK